MKSERPNRFSVGRSVFVCSVLVDQVVQDPNHEFWKFLTELRDRFGEDFETPDLQDPEP